VSDMTEIEKAIDEFERAVTDVADHNWYHDIVPTMLERLISKRDAKRERLLVLINVDALNQRIAELEKQLQSYKDFCSAIEREE